GARRRARDGAQPHPRRAARVRGPHEARGGRRRDARRTALTEAVRSGIDRRAMVALSGGHFAVDFASGSVPALIPSLASRFSLGSALSAGLLLAATISSSLVQPLFGLWSDRRGALWLIPGGILLAAVGVGGAAVSREYALVVVLVF